LVCVNPARVEAFRKGLGEDDLFVQVGEVLAGEAGILL
jgi:hypothetical protein